MTKPNYRLTPIGVYSPVAAAAASLAVQGVDPVDALRYAPIAAAIDRIDDASPIDPSWPGIGIVDVDGPAPRPLPPAAYVLELHPIGEEN